MPAQPVKPLAEKKEPEDIFSQLEQPKKPIGSGPLVSAPSPAGSGAKFAVIAVTVVAVLGIGGFGFWFFAIRKPASEGKAPVQEILPETPPPASVPPPAPEAPPPAGTVPAAATSAEESLSIPPPVTSTPPGANIPPPQPIGSGGETASSTIPETDTDADGLSDRRETELGTDPARADTDGDAVSDGDEVLKYGTNPLNPDTDGDGYQDGMEIKSGYNPRGPGKCAKAGCVL